MTDYVDLLENFIKEFNKLPADVKRQKAKEMLINMGVLDKDGNPKETIVNR